MANYISEEVIFSNVKAGINTGGQKITKAPYQYDNQGNIVNPQTLINVIDIDWNNAQVPGLDEPITNTVSFLLKVGEINNTIKLINQTLLSINDNIDMKASQEEVNTALEQINGSLETKASQEEVNSAIEQINASIQELGESIGDNDIINNKFDEIDQSLSDLQELLSTLSENHETRITNNETDINEIKAQIQGLLDGTIKPTNHIEHIILTEAEYEALEDKNPNAIYFITEDEDNPVNPDDEEEDITSTKLYINGVLHEEDNVVLQPGHVYTLQGVCLGTITVDTTDGAPLENTELRLNNVTLINSGDYGIKYLTPTENTGYKDLVITLEKNSKNYIICQQEAQPSEDQPGAVYSMNNLTIQGAGYLAAYNAGGHAIRGTELKLLAPHIYADASHDAMHAKKIWICSGTYYVNKANDAFGTSSGGSIMYAFGYISSNNLVGKVFNAKDGGTLKYVENFDLHNDADYESTASESIIPSTPNGTVKEYDDKTSAANGSGGTDVSNSGGMYAVTKQFIRVTGYINQPINIPSSLTDVTIYLNNAIIVTSEVSGTNEPSIAYDASSSNVKITCIKDTYNVIMNQCSEIVEGQDADAVKSEHNIRVEIKNDSYLYISATAGDGLDGTDVEITDSKGTLMIHNCAERGIKGNTIMIGPSGSTSGSTITVIDDPTNEKYTTFDGAVIVTENCKEYGEQLISISSNRIAPYTGYADIFARKGKALDKGTFKTVASTLNGIIVTGSIGASIEVDMNNSANIYYNRLVTLDTVTLTDVATPSNETYIAYPYKNNPISK